MRRLFADEGRGLHSFTSNLNLRTLRSTLLTLELNLSTFGTHPRINLGYTRQSELNLSGQRQSKLKLSGNGNECKPLDEGTGGVLGSLPAIYTKMVPYTMFQLATYDVASTTLRDAVAGFDGVSVPPILIQLPASFLVGPGRYCFKCPSAHLPTVWSVSK